MTNKIPEILKKINEAYGRLTRTLSDEKLNVGDSELGKQHPEHSPEVAEVTSKQREQSSNSSNQKTNSGNE